jgi:hypothetical protein
MRVALWRSGRKDKKQAMYSSRLNILTTFQDTNVYSTEHLKASQTPISYLALTSYMGWTATDSSISTEPHLSQPFGYLRCSL